MTYIRSQNFISAQTVVILGASASYRRRHPVWGMSRLFQVNWTPFFVRLYDNTYLLIYRQKSKISVITLSICNTSNKRLAVQMKNKGLALNCYFIYDRRTSIVCNMCVKPLYHLIPLMWHCDVHQTSRLYQSYLMHLLHNIAFTLVCFMSTVSIYYTVFFTFKCS